MQPTRFFVGVLFIAAGTAVLTYAVTRTWTTEYVLSRAASHVGQYLEVRGVSKDSDRESRELWCKVLESGGMYFWSNEAAPYYAAAPVLLAVGVMAPFVRFSKRPT